MRRPTAGGVTRRRRGERGRGGRRRRAREVRHERHGQGHPAKVAQRLRQEPARHTALAWLAPDRPHRRGRRFARRCAACSHKVRHLVEVARVMSATMTTKPAKPEERIGLHNLKPAPGSRTAAQARRPRRGSGTGKTAGRGQKGYGSRLGAKHRARFEGGQTPIHMRMRKLRGPHMKKSMPFEPFRTHTQPVNLADLEARFDAGDAVTPGSAATPVWRPARASRSRCWPRASSPRRSPFTPTASSKSAREAIEAAGGTCRHRS